MVENLFQQAMGAFKAGRKDEARTLFMDIVERDKNHEQAWLYLSALVETLEEQQICLENVLTVNPNNEKAKKGLETVRHKLATQSDVPEPPGDWATGFSTTPSATPPPSAPFAGSSSPPIGAEFESVSGDNLFGEPTFGEASTDSSSPFGSGFDFEAASAEFAASSAEPQGADDPFNWLNDAAPPQAADPTPPTPPAEADPFGVPASSVEWGQADQPAAYGSGRQIDEPTSEDYDNWMDNLPLGSEASDVTESDKAEEDSVFGSTPFGDTSHMIEDDLFETELSFGTDVTSEPASDSPWDSSFADETAFDSSHDEDAFAAFGTETPDVFEPTDDLFESTDEFVDDTPASASPFGSSPFDDVVDEVYVEPEVESSGFDFSFDDDDSPVAPAAAETEKSNVSDDAARAAAAEYYRQIPGEIEPFEGGITQHSLVLVGGIVMMVLLNVASIVMLL